MHGTAPIHTHIYEIIGMYLIWAYTWYQWRVRTEHKHYPTMINPVRTEHQHYNTMINPVRTEHQYIQGYIGETRW